MADEGVTVPKWAVRVVPLVGAIVVSIVSLMAWSDGRYVLRPEWKRSEDIAAKETLEIEDALTKHIDQTRLDAVRLGTIEAQDRKSTRLNSSH